MEQNGDDTSAFNLSHVRRYYETGVKSAIGEAQIEYIFPTDAVRRIEEKHISLCRLAVSDGKNYCRANYHAITSLFDPYENKLFVNAMNSIN